MNKVGHFGQFKNLMPSNSEPDLDRVAYVQGRSCRESLLFNTSASQVALRKCNDRYYEDVIKIDTDACI